MLYGSAGGRPGLVGAVDQQAPDLLERDPADDLLDVDAAVAQRGPFLVGLGDLGLERDDALEPVVHLSHVATPSARAACCPASRRHSCTTVGRRRPAAAGRRDPARPTRLTRARERTGRPGRAAGGVHPRRPRRARPRRPTRSRCCSRWMRRARRRRAARAQRDGGRDRRRRRPRRRRGWCCSRASTARLRLLHQHDSRKGDELAGQPALRAALPVAPARAPGPGRGRRRRRCPRAEVEAYFAQPAARLPARRLGLAPVRGSWPSREELDAGVRGGGGALRRRTTCRAGRTGAASGSQPEMVEFWQGRPGRMHDRLVYRRGSGAAPTGWHVERPGAVTAGAEDPCE